MLCTVQIVILGYRNKTDLIQFTVGHFVQCIQLQCSAVVWTAVNNTAYTIVNFYEMMAQIVADL